MARVSFSAEEGGRGREREGMNSPKQPTVCRREARAHHSPGCLSGPVSVLLAQLSCQLAPASVEPLCRLPSLRVLEPIHSFSTFSIESMGLMEEAWCLVVCSSLHRKEEPVTLSRMCVQSDLLGAPLSVLIRVLLAWEPIAWAVPSTAASQDPASYRGS